MADMYLVFDTETSGLPETPCFGSYYPPLTHLECYDSSRLLQIAWQLRRVHDHSLVHEMKTLVRPEGKFSIDPGAQRVHGIYAEEADVRGIKLELVLAAFRLDAQRARTLVGHNVGFDLHVVGAEVVRLEQPHWIKFWTKLRRMPLRCTMNASIDLCRLPWPGSKKKHGRKAPKLVELYAFLFDGETFDGAHDALADVSATSRAMIELVARGLLQLASSKQTLVACCGTRKRIRDADASADASADAIADASSSRKVRKVTT